MTNEPSNGATPEVAVIVPVYNDASRLAKCLAALSEQSYPRDRYRVIVVDNGSTEDIPVVCAQFSGVACVREQAPGSYAARNLGISSSSSEVVAFTDADCIPTSNWLERLTARLREAPNIGLVGGRIEVFYADPDRPTSVELFEGALAFPQRQFVEENHWAATANMATFRSVIEDVGPFDPQRRSGGDAEWGRRVHEHGYTLVYAHDAVVRHPARATLEEVRKKETRVAGGLHRMIDTEASSIAEFAYYLARTTYYTIRRTGRLLLGMNVMMQDLRSLSIVDRMRVAFVLNYVHGTRVVELMRLRWNSDREEAR